jgi:succinyl-diaminopimelate desuccinylase
LETSNSGDAFITHDTQLQNKIIHSVQKVTGITPKLDTTGGTSDARFLKDICSVLEFGLISDQAHKVDEHVAIADLISLTAIYKDFFMSLT